MTLSERSKEKNVCYYQSPGCGKDNPYRKASAFWGAFTWPGGKIKQIMKTATPTDGIEKQRGNLGFDTS
jgi:hypothetical protein